MSADAGPEKPKRDVSRVMERLAALRRSPERGKIVVKIGEVTIKGTRMSYQSHPSKKDPGKSEYIFRVPRGIVRKIPDEYIGKEFVFLDATSTTLEGAIEEVQKNIFEVRNESRDERLAREFNERITRDMHPETLDALKKLEKEGKVSAEDANTYLYIHEALGRGEIAFSKVDRALAKKIGGLISSSRVKVSPSLPAGVSSTERVVAAGDDMPTAPGEVGETGEQRAERERVGQETRDVARRTGESHYRLRRIDEYMIIQAALNAEPPELDQKHVNEFYEWNGARLMSTSVPRFFDLKRKKEMPPVVRAVERFIKDKLAAKRAEQKVALRDKNKNEKEKEFNEAVTVGKTLFSEQHSELNAALSNAVAEKTLQLLANDVDVFYAMYAWFRDVKHILEFKPSSISSVFGELLTTDQKRSLTKVQRILRPLVEGPRETRVELGKKILEARDSARVARLERAVTEGMMTRIAVDMEYERIARMRR